MLALFWQTRLCLESTQPKAPRARVSRAGKVLCAVLAPAAFAVGEGNQISWQPRLCWVTKRDCISPARGVCSCNTSHSAALLILLCFQVFSKPQAGFCSVWVTKDRKCSLGRGIKMSLSVQPHSDYSLWQGCVSWATAARWEQSLRSCSLLTWPFQQLHSQHIPGLQFVREWPVKSLCRGCVRASLSNPALLCVIQRLPENGKELAFSKYVQCINNACPCAAELGENVCRTSGPEGYWDERHKPIYLIVVFCFSFYWFWCTWRAGNFNICIILALLDKINILCIYLDYFLKDPTPCIPSKNLWNPIKTRPLLILLQSYPKSNSSLQTYASK